MDTVAEAPSEMRRVFLALWPDDPTRDQLAALARDLDGPGRPVPRDHLHLTLAFAGTVPTARAECLARHIGTLARPPIPLNLDCLGHFTRPRITWTGPSDPPPELAELAQAARALCAECGIDLGPERPFRPHVSLRRHATPPAIEQLASPIEWQADTVVLVESGRDGQPGPYRILARA